MLHKRIWLILGSLALCLGAFGASEGGVRAVKPASTILPLKPMKTLLHKKVIIKTVPLFVFLLATFSVAGWTIPAPTAELARSSSISLKDLKAAMVKGEVSLIDCTGSYSYSRRHIPGAIDFEACQGRLAKLLPSDKDALIVCYCSNKNCPMYKNGVEAAARLGYRHIKHFTPGIRGWANAGERMESVSSNR